MNTDKGRSDKPQVTRFRWHIVPLISLLFPMIAASNDTTSRFQPVDNQLHHHTALEEPLEEGPFVEVKKFTGHCRTGSLENCVVSLCQKKSIHCRTGSLEIAESSRGASYKVHCRTPYHGSACSFAPFRYRVTFLADSI